MQMPRSNPSTAFAPAARAAGTDIARQRAVVKASAAVQVAFDVMPLPIVVLNGTRQIVYANDAFARTFGPTLPEGLVGLRPGEAVGCHNSDRTPGGCGTTEACRTCGVVKSTLAAARGKGVSEDCRITLKPPARDLDVRVWTRPFNVHAESFVVMTLMDISDEKRREALERIFFHDVLNSAAQVKAFGALLPRVPAAKAARYLESLLRSSDHMIEQIEAQRDLTNGERGELDVHVTSVRTQALLESIVDGVRYECGAADSSMAISSESVDVAFATDRVLISRVLSNLVKNALEACPAGGAVAVWCTAHDGRIEFRIHNPAFMPPEVQNQVFQRSFSTKGRGRGLGAYSARLLTERYLQGAISFETAEQTGTTFIVAVPLDLPERPLD